MTREQAIVHGKEQLEIFGGEHREFIEMAIKALEQEPTTKIEESNFSQEQYKADLQSAYDCGYEQAKNDLGVERQIKGICISYPKSDLKEHDGQPYYSVKYIENGEEYEGYGTYKIEVFMEYLKNYFMPSVTPQEPQTGHWIVAKGGSYLGMRNGCCSNCKDFYTNDWNVMNYCPNCGAKMVEPQESEDKCKNCKYYLNPDYTRCHECKAESER